ncbi:MAG: hypothetical protein HY393_02280 [Candidatus Diapherotrites archaeon]|nr:hypothetical protein [Candidatus Diapherotrites archaeon]
MEFKKNIAWPKEIGRDDLHAVGKEAMALVEAANSGIPLPPFFAVTVYAHKTFLNQKLLGARMRERLNEMRIEDDASVQQTCQAIKEMMLSLDLPPQLKHEIKSAYHKLGEKNIAWLSEGTDERVTLKASNPSDEGTNHWKKENISGAESVVQNIKECWASTYSLEAVRERAAKHVEFEDSGNSVLVQRLLQGEVMGMIYSQDPEEAARMLLEVQNASSSSENVFRFGIEKAKLKVIEKPAQMPFKFEDALALQLAEVAKRAEQHYGFPVQIEWVLEKDRVFALHIKPLKLPIALRTDAEIILPQEAKPTPNAVPQTIEEETPRERVQEVTHAPVENVQPPLALIEGPEEKTPDLPMTTNTTMTTVFDEHENAMEPKEENLNAPEQKAPQEELEKPEVTEKITHDQKVHVHAFLVEPHTTLMKHLQEADQVIVPAETLLKERNISGSEVESLESQRALVEGLKHSMRTLGTFFPQKTLWLRTWNEGNELQNPLEPHGLHQDFAHPERFKSQLIAVKELQDEGLSNVHVLLAGVSTSDEFQQAKQTAKDLGFTPGKDLKLGGWIDTPAGIGIIQDLLAEGMAFACVPLESLARLTIGRKDITSATLLHPSLMGQIKYALQKSKDMDTPFMVFLPTQTPIPSLQYLADQGIEHFIVPANDVEKTIQRLT